MLSKYPRDVEIAAYVEITPREMYLGFPFIPTKAMKERSSYKQTNTL